MVKVEDSQPRGRGIEYQPALCTGWNIKQSKATTNIENWNERKERKVTMVHTKKNILGNKSKYIKDEKICKSSDNILHLCKVSFNLESAFWLNSWNNKEHVDGPPPLFYLWESC